MPCGKGTGVKDAVYAVTSACGALSVCLARLWLHAPSSSERRTTVAPFEGWCSEGLMGAQSGLKSPPPPHHTAQAASRRPRDALADPGVPVPPTHKQPAGPLGQGGPGPPRPAPSVWTPCLFTEASSVHLWPGIQADLPVSLSPLAFHSRKSTFSPKVMP